MWTPTTRRQHSREGLRYETDLTHAEWALIEPLMPKPCARGRPREWPLREVLNAIFYLLRGGVTWRLLPSDLPPRSTSSADSADGATRACSRRSTTCWSWPIGRGSAARHRPRPRSSTVMVSRLPRAAAREATT